MTIHKKITAAAAALIMAFSAVPMSAAAARVNVSIAETTLAEAISYSYFENIDEAGAYVREELKKHTEELHIRLSRRTNVNDILNEVLGAALAETGVPDEGEFLRLSIEGYKAGTGRINREPCLDISFTYNATLDQDEAAKRKADEILADLALDGKSEYEKIDAVYEYLTTHVVYSSEEKDEIYTAYGALVNDDAVCQGFIQALYYMLTASGVSCRAVMGKGNDGDHVWAIAGIDGTYYYLDPTWDSNFKGVTRWFFLKGINDFDEFSTPVVHIPGLGDPKNIAFIPDSTVENFLPDYPISEYKYAPSALKVILGDINSDNIIDIFDLIAIKQGLINGFSTQTAEMAADADSSGEVSVNDAVLIQKYIHGTIRSFSEVS